MEMIRRIIMTLARFCISLAFLVGAVNKIIHWNESERVLINTLFEWQTYVSKFDFFQEILSLATHSASLLLLVGTSMELLGGLSVLLGVREKLGAFLLLIFLIPATVLMHQFWFVEGALREAQLAHFLKNISIMGGLLIIMIQGTECSESDYS